MEKNTKYHGYSSSSGVVRNFWKVVRELTPEDQKKLVKFVTGYPNAESSRGESKSIGEKRRGEEKRGE